MSFISGSSYTHAQIINNFSNTRNQVRATTTGISETIWASQKLQYVYQNREELHQFFQGKNAK